MGKIREQMHLCLMKLFLLQLLFLLHSQPFSQAATGIEIMEYRVKHSYHQ